MRGKKRKKKGAIKKMKILFIKDKNRKNENGTERI